MIDDHQNRAEEQDTDRVRMMLHAAGLVLVSAIYAGIGEVVARTLNWLNVHVDESHCVRRATDYNQRAYRVLRPWWEAADKLARWRAERAADWHAEHQVRQHAERGTDGQPTRST